MRLLLIRHGEIDCNRQARFCGITNPPLNKTGRAQAGQLRKLLRRERVHPEQAGSPRRVHRERVDLVYASPLRRARETAAIVFGKRRIFLSPDLQEINFGKIETLTLREVRERYQSFYRQWLASPEKAKAPGGESVTRCRQRVWRFFHRLTRNKSNQNKTIALVMHGGSIKLLLSKILRWGTRGFWSFHPEPASVTTIEYGAGKFCLLQRNLYYEKSDTNSRWRP